MINFIKEKVEQQIVLSLLEPEWKARCESFVFMKKQKIYSKRLKKKIELIFKNFQKIRKNVSKIYFSINTNIKSINNQYLVSKINNIETISIKLNLWLNSQSLVNYNLEKPHKSFFFHDNNKNNLYKLLEQILYLGIEWHIYVNMKIKKIYEKLIFINRKKLFFINYSNLNIYISLFIKKLDIELNLVKYRNTAISNYKINLKDIDVLIKPNQKIKISPSDHSIKFLLGDIRSILYHKNHIGQWRLNTYLTLSKARLVAKKILLSWYESYYCILDNTQISKINIAVDKIFYTWQIKK